jgi:phage terminase small subunit
MRVMEPDEYKLPAEVTADLNELQRLFVQEYCHDFDPQAAARRAGYKSITPTAAKAILRNGKVSAAISEILNARAKRMELSAESVLRMYWAVATADPNDVVQHRRVCCRYCYGNGHEYQWRNEREYQAALARALSLQEQSEANTKADKRTIADQLPTDAGGYGFNSQAAPNPDCPECDGIGTSEVWFADTRSLPPESRALFAGVKQTKEGLEVKLHSQLDALQQVGRHLGLFQDKLRIDHGVTDELAELLQHAQGRAIAPRINAPDVIDVPTGTPHAAE